MGLPDAPNGNFARVQRVCDSESARMASVGSAEYLRLGGLGRIVKCPG